MRQHLVLDELRVSFMGVFTFDNRFLAVDIILNMFGRISSLAEASLCSFRRFDAQARFAEVGR